VRRRKVETRKRSRARLVCMGWLDMVMVGVVVSNVDTTEGGGNIGGRTRKEAV
jgi:hypothetical protein